MQTYIRGYLKPFVATLCGLSLTLTLPLPLSAQGSKADTSSDNTKVNQVHDGDKALTADQQSNGAGDVEVTRKIRRAITEDTSLSTYAHNVKIITNKGQVVLKGPVRSDAEKKKIEETAAQVAGGDKVKSEISVTAQ